MQNFRVSSIQKIKKGEAMEFDRYFILTPKGIEKISTVKKWLDDKLGLEYEVEGNVITVFSITSQEDDMLNKWLEKNNYQ